MIVQVQLKDENNCLGGCQKDLASTSSYGTVLNEISSKLKLCAYLNVEASDPSRSLLPARYLEIKPCYMNLEMNYQIGLTTLPHELQLLITSYLTTPEKQLLRATCAHFCNFLPPPTRLCLFDITFSIYNHKAYTPCYTCMTLTPSSEWYLAPPNVECAAVIRTSIPMRLNQANWRRSGRS